MCISTTVVQKSSYTHKMSKPQTKLAVVWTASDCSDLNFILNIYSVRVWRLASVNRCTRAHLSTWVCKMAVCVVAAVFLFILLQDIVLYAVMCSILSHALLSIGTCDWIWITNWNVTLGLFRFIPFPVLPQLIATLIHYPFTIPFPGLADWSAML